MNGWGCISISCTNKPLISPLLSSLTGVTHNIQPWHSQFTILHAHTYTSAATILSISNRCALLIPFDQHIAMHGFTFTHTHIKYGPLDHSLINIVLTQLEKQTEAQTITCIVAGHQRINHSSIECIYTFHHWDETHDWTRTKLCFFRVRFYRSEIIQACLPPR